VCSILDSRTTQGYNLPVTTERLPGSLIALKFEIDDERLEASMGKAVRRVAQQVKIPGFRPGKAPRQVVERTVGRSALVQEALDDLLPDLYEETLQSEEIEAIAQPEFEIESIEPLIVNAKVPVRPTIDLGDYMSLRAPREDVTATDEQVEESIVNLQRRFATLEPADRAVDWDDTVRADVTVSVDGQGDPHVEEDAEFRLTKDSVISLPGFLDELIGLERGGPYDFSFDLPDDYAAQDIAGKSASYTVTIHEVKQEVLPELDDDFAKSLDEEGVETVEALRTRMQESVQEQLESDAKSAYQDEILDMLLASADLDYPEVLVEQDIHRLIDQLSNHASHTQEDLDRWLTMIGKTEQEVRDEQRPQAEQGVQRMLVLSELIKAEEIEVPDSEVDGEIDKMIDQISGESEDEEQRTAVRNMVDTPEGRTSILDGLITRAALDALVEICSQPEEDEGTESARGSRRRRGSRRAGAEASDETDESASEGTGDSEDAENEEAGQAE
jgi:trigger factor